MSQFRKPGIAAATIVSLMLAACGGSSHPVCVDEKTTQEYSRQFVTDMIAAAGRIDPKSMLALQAEIDGISKGSSTDFGGFCTKLDALRTKYSL